MKKFLFVIMMTSLVFLSAACEAVDDKEDEDKEIIETTIEPYKMFTDTLNEYLDKLQTSETLESCTFNTLPSLQFPYQDSMTTLELKEAVDLDYDQSCEESDNKRYVHPMIYNFLEYGIKELDPKTSYQGIYNLTSSIEVEYTFTFDISDDLLSYELYESYTSRDNLDYNEIKGLRVEAYLFDGSVVLDYMTTSTIHSSFMNSDQDSVEKGTLYENGITYQNIDYTFSIDSVIQSKNIANTYADFNANRMFTASENEYTSTNNYYYSSSEDNILLNYSYLDSIIDVFTATFYIDQYPAFQIELDNIGGNGLSSLYYNLMYCDGWTRYSYEDGVHIYRGQDELLTNENLYEATITTKVLPGIDRVKFGFDFSDIELDVDGITMSGIDFNQVKQTLDDTTLDYFKGLENTYFIYDVDEAIDFQLDNPYTD